MRQLKITNMITIRENECLKRYLNEISQENLLTPNEENGLKRGSKFGKRYSSTSKWIIIANAYTAIWVTKAQMNLNNRKSLNSVSVVAGSDQFCGSIELPNRAFVDGYIGMLF